MSPEPDSAPEAATDSADSLSVACLSDALADELDDPELVDDLPAAGGRVPEMATLAFDIPHLQQRMRVDNYLTQQIKHATRNRVQQAIAQGRVRINGAVVSKNSRQLLAGDRLEITLLRPAPEDLKAQDMPLDILYEDESLLVLHKPPGIAVHPTYKHWDYTLANGLLAYFRRQLNDPEAKIKPGLIHRLDKDTSGVLLIGKTPEAKRLLGKQFEYRKTHKVYRALVWGRPQHNQGLLETNLGLGTRHRARQVVYPYESRHGKPARTGWKVLQRFEQGLSLLEVELFTGRTHQIRAHMAHLGHPIWGDSLYGGRLEEFPEHHPLSDRQRAAFAPLSALLPRQALHAAILHFQHPADQRPMRCEAPLPADMQAAIDWLLAQG